jgi:hypothetical protein
MTRFLRRILNGLTAISLLLCGLTLLSWQSGRSEMIEMGWSFHYALELGWHDGRIFGLGAKTIHGQARPAGFGGMPNPSMNPGTSSSRARPLRPAGCSCCCAFHVDERASPSVQNN